MTPIVRNIIWDVDGTLFDTYPAIARAIQAALYDFGTAAPLDWIADLAQVSLGHCTATLAAQYELNENEIGERFNFHYDQVRAEDQPPFPGVVEICETICSMGGTNVIVTHRGQAGTVELLEAHQMTHLFAGWITRNDGHAKKPDPAAFEAAIRQYDLKREETITVGDREIDIAAGQGAGLFSCYFGTKASAADMVLHDFAELSAYILKMNKIGS